MVYLRVQASCFHCKNMFEKTEMRGLPSVTKEERFECFPCFKKYSREPLQINREVKLKQGFQCLRCNYKYESTVDYCPYCNKKDQVILGELTVDDVLS